MFPPFLQSPWTVATLLYTEPRDTAEGMTLYLSPAILARELCVRVFVCESDLVTRSDRVLEETQTQHAVADNVLCMAYRGEHTQSSHLSALKLGQAVLFGLIGQQFHCNLIAYCNSSGLNFSTSSWLCFQALENLSHDGRLWPITGHFRERTCYYWLFYKCRRVCMSLQMVKDLQNNLLNQHWQQLPTLLDCKAIYKRKTDFKKRV